jgi:hypothetical protein
MKIVKNGLEFYANFNTYIVLIIGIIISMCAIGFTIKIYNDKYIKSPKSYIDYYSKDFINDKCSSNEIKNNLCELKVTYTDGKNEYKQSVDPKSSVGSTTVYYKQKDPMIIMVTPFLYMFPSIFCIISIIMIIIGVGRLYIIKSSNNGALALGAFDVASNMMRNN